MLMELATALASRQIITCPPPGHPTQVVTQLEDEAPVVVTCLCTCGLAQQTPSQQAPLPGTTPPVTQVTPRRLVFNTTSGVDAPTVGEEDYPPGVGLVDLTADADLDSTPSVDGNQIVDNDDSFKRRLDNFTKKVVCKRDSLQIQEPPKQRPTKAVLPL